MIAAIRAAEPPHRGCGARTRSWSGSRARRPFAHDGGDGKHRELERWVGVFTSTSSSGTPFTVVLRAYTALVGATTHALTRRACRRPYCTTGACRRPILPRRPGSAGCDVSGAFSERWLCVRRELDRIERAARHCPAQTRADHGTLSERTMPSSCKCTVASRLSCAGTSRRPRSRRPAPPCQEDTSLNFVARRRDRLVGSVDGSTALRTPASPRRSRTCPRTRYCRRCRWRT